MLGAPWHPTWNACVKTSRDTRVSEDSDLVSLENCEGNALYLPRRIFTFSALKSFPSKACRSVVSSYSVHPSDQMSVLLLYSCSEQISASSRHECRFEGEKSQTAEKRHAKQTWAIFKRHFRCRRDWTWAHIVWGSNAGACHVHSLI